MDRQKSTDTNRRLTWLTNAFSKKVENRAHSVALLAHDVLQLLPHSPNAARYPGDESGRIGSRLGLGRGGGVAAMNLILQS